MIQTVTVREVRLLVMGGTLISQIKLIKMNYRHKSCYRIEFVLEVNGNYLESILITTRNEPHRWSDLNRAVRFVRHLFPDVSVIQVFLYE